MKLALVLSLLQFGVVKSAKVTPKVHPFSFLGTAKPGNNARTTCFLVEGDTPVTFTWLRNGVDASTLKNVHVQTQTDFSVLSINPVDASSSGNFTCIAKNRAGFDSFTTYLDVEASPEWKHEPQDTGGALGTELTLLCSAAGSPLPKIQWYKLKTNSERQLSKKIVRHQSAAHPNGTLVLSNLDINDMGQYMCEADNGVEPSLKKTITVRVNEVPEIRPFAFPPNLRVGEKALLTCHVTSGSQPITFSWLKDGNTMAANQGIRLRSESEYSVMLMESVHPTHVGNYTCIAKNKHGFDSFTAVLEVESAPTWKGLARDKSVDWNKTLQLDCPAVGYPQPKVSFKKKAGKSEQEWVDITGPGHYTIHRNGSLVIHQVELADAGSYLCEAHNGVLPNARHVVRITVNGERISQHCRLFRYPEILTRQNKTRFIPETSATDPCSWYRSSDSKPTFYCITIF
ncbi:Down syndrome cell adhesion molecule-like protein Dscam2 [Ixodes scapularis]|uniref:Down syndrome cell adhesion molecule-like protein Dscam2 n=1 Tax=Ixodes scapularis TaxID=6945 RepID=UPI001C394460|nr:Down syndrome cell adhesion molecule-like protein Dscam2 [Ixodes scapularis]